MKLSKTYRLLALLLLLLPLGALQLPARTYRAQPAASHLTWTGYAEVGSYAPAGTVQLREGTLDYDGRTVRGARVVLDMRTIRHDDATLTRHLQGPDFFDVEHYPTAVFVLTALRREGAVGQLTVRGVTQPVQFPARLQPLPDGRLRLTGTATLDRTRFGVNYNSSSFFQNLGSYAIRNDFTLAFDLVAAP